MKIFFGTILLGAVLLAGCSTTQRPPSAAEQKFFVIETNYVTEVRQVTNAVTVTNLVAGIPMPVTNYSVLTVTNLTPQYTFTPNTNAAGIAATTGALTNLGAPGAGPIATAIATSIFGLWGMFRSRRANQATAALAQTIETGEQILLALPHGPALAAQYKAWMVKHQAEAGVIGDVSKLVANVVDTESARSAAQQINTLITTATKS